VENLQPRNDRYRYGEALLALSFVLLKLHVLYDTWGISQGYDRDICLAMLRTVRWFGPLPASSALSYSYHPPLAFLIGRLIYGLYPHAVEVSQIASTLAVLVGLFSLRYVLRFLGWLWTLPGMWLLYGGFSIPIIVSLGVETTIESWVLAWFMLAVAVSVSLFWHQTSRPWWKDNPFARRVTLLGLVLAAGLLNKYTGLLALGVPFVIIAIRRGIKATLRESGAPIVAVLIAIVVVFPYYYEHNYKVQGIWMPGGVEYWRSQELAQARAERDAAPFTFIAHMVRYPRNLPSDPQTPVLDSFVHSIWLHTWTRDVVLGKQPEASLAISRLYSGLFAVVTLVGTALFLARRRRIPSTWRHLGWVILCIASYECLAALAFGWRYPLWDWRVFKTKYMSPAVLWIPYAAAVGFADDWFVARQATWLRWFETVGFYALVAFVLINHLLPVY
jgi:hypothetical protein